MTRGIVNRARVGATALAVALLAGTTVPAAAAAQGRPALQAAMQAIVDSGFTGVQLRVRDRRGDWTGSAGVRELGAAAKPPTGGRFRIGSTTKTFTSVVVLRLVAEGKLGLDAPVAGYLPELGFDPRLTVRMLLQHTSGLFNYTGEYYDDGTVAPGIAWSGQEWVDNRFRTYRPQELVRYSLARPPRFAPGAGWSYANTNYVVARLLIEKVTGRSYADELQRQILRPLGLRDTVVPGTSPEIPGPHAHAYYRYSDAGQEKTVDISRQNPSWISSAGEMISTTGDLATFYSALLGGRLLPAPLLAEMLKTHPTPDPTSDYGLGVFELHADANCSGNVLFTHNGSVQGYGTLVYSAPDGARTMVASITYVDTGIAPTEAYQNAVRRLLAEVFCAGRQVDEPR
ncbi:serine hydrolase [Amycolatopsis sp. MtRt-6]|uniref:serine hydrolase domain-containing protein n=1 Tax=Amycolatopsis sp. MtRt-6 TaxID=2792782 RepID=UPI001A8E9A83|nr:serine hydrolase domain-containing protein [Amycolatopsis sp. MtRt-6]